MANRGAVELIVKTTTEANMPIMLWLVFPMSIWLRSSSSIRRSELGCEQKVFGWISGDEQALLK
jgi:hypothetical protein